MREVGTRSHGRFKATAVAGYERGERGISLQRFCDLAVLYEIEPDRLLAEVIRRIAGRPVVTIDLERLQASADPEAEVLERFARRVAERRGATSQLITLRSGDLSVLATAAGVSEQRILAAVGTDPNTRGSSQADPEGY